jgi:hypothetical protein
MADEVATCPHCQRVAEIPRRFRGGLVNCTGCGRAIEVPGSNDPLWVGLCVLIVLAALFVAWVASAHHGPWFGLGAGTAVLGGSWLLSRAL